MATPVSVILPTVAPHGSSCSSCRDNRANASGATSCSGKSASDPPQGAEADSVLLTGTCACGRYELCIDGQWRSRVYRGGGWDLLDLRLKPKPCVGCGQVLTPREGTS